MGGDGSLVNISPDGHIRWTASADLGHLMMPATQGNLVVAISGSDAYGSAVSANDPHKPKVKRAKLEDDLSHADFQMVVEHDVGEDEHAP